MKLSAMNTRELKKALCAITLPLSTIANSQEIQAIVEKAGNGQEVQSRATVFAAVLPVLLDQYESETFAILSALTGKTVDQLMEQNGTDTLTDIKECMDGTLLGFFKLFGPTKKRP